MSEKTNDPILRKLSDGRAESDFIGRCPPNVERPKKKSKNNSTTTHRNNYFKVFDVNCRYYFFVKPLNRY